MESVLEVDRHSPSSPPSPRRRLSRRKRWVIGLAAGALFAAVVGFVVADEVQAQRQYEQARSSLGTTRHRTQTVSAQLRELQRDLRLLQAQVGSDTTALSQDAAQLLGAQTSLSAAQAHVGQQSTLITSLQTCLVGVEQALNELAVGQQAKAIAALNSVSNSCTAAEGSSG
jgi:chromosome segregation ATPase